MYRAVDSPFNRKNYPELIGKTFSETPSYVQVEEVGLPITQEQLKVLADAGEHGGHCPYHEQEHEQEHTPKEPEELHCLCLGSWTKLFFLEAVEEEIKRTEQANKETTLPGIDYTQASRKLKEELEKIPTCEELERQRLTGFRALPTVELEGKKYFVDLRLKQVRNVENPYDFHSFDSALGRKIHVADIKPEP